MVRADSLFPMDSGTLANFGLVLLFVLIGGVFSGTEMAIVSLRHGQVKKFEESGPRGRRVADLVRNPNLFLSAVQIGVTVAGFFSSAYGASTLAPDIEPWLVSLGLSAGAARTVALIGMTLLIAYLSLVLGELAPKRMAMQNAVAITRMTAPPLDVFSRVMRPVIWFLSASTNLVVRLLGGDPSAHTEAVSVEEIRSIVSDTEAIAEGHRRILKDVFEAAERTVLEVMRPRPEVDFLAADQTVRDAIASIRGLPHSRFPVYGEDTDDIVGFVHIRDLIALERDSVTVREQAREILMFPGTVHVLRALTEMRKQGHQIAVVVDEYGGTDGIVTLEDLLEEVVGEIYDEYDVAMEPEDTAVLDQGGTVEVDAGLILQEFMQLTGIELPDDGSYETVGGFVMSRLGRLAEPGDVVSFPGYELRVLNTDRTRIGRIQVTAAEPGAETSSPTGSPAE